MAMGRFRMGSRFTTPGLTGKINSAKIINHFRTDDSQKRTTFKDKDTTS